MGIKTNSWIRLLLLAALTVHAGEILTVGNFSEGDLKNWKTKSFAGQTYYQFAKLNDRTVLKAESKASASGLFKEIEVNVAKTPYLHWCWQLIQPLPPLPETSKPGDDYAARIYLVKKGGLAFWRTRALNYVWSSSQAKESLWPNAFAGDNVMMLAVRNAKDKPGQWRCEKRDLRADWQRVFGKPAEKIDVIAIMTDSDNSKKSTAAYYGDIWFSED
ncbi:MAG TPA: DUF3047 domain-containing protein [Methylothermaceae bacterium]|nr:DUF3047 domain-containing protein [Methylothermaceae bacterium]